MAKVRVYFTSFIDITVPDDYSKEEAISFAEDNALYFVTNEEIGDNLTLSDEGSTYYEHYE